MQIMLSGGYRKENPIIYKSLDIKQNIAFIPSWFHEDSINDFNKFCRQFKNAKINFFPLDKISKSKIEKLFKSDVIYIEGGNTYVLLHFIKKLKLHNKFKKFVKTKTLVGMSAGSIIQTPNINLAGIPYFNADENFINVKNNSALNLVKFEIYPHFDIKDEKEIKELTKYSKTNKREIVLIPDGTHIVLQEQSKKIVGKYWTLKGGKLCEK